MSVTPEELLDAIRGRNAITEDTVRQISRLLEEEAELLARRLTLRTGRGTSVAAIRRSMATLRAQLTSIVHSGGVLTAQEVQDAYTALTGRLLDRAGMNISWDPSGIAADAAARALQSGARFGSVTKLITANVSAVERRLLNEMTRGTLLGEGGTTVARRLRGILLGEEGVAGHNLSYLTRRIAVSTINNAHHAAHVQAAVLSPVVKALKWNTNSFRGATHYDVCDELAGQDLFGMGAGVFPVAQAPHKPHPFCKCYTTAVLFDPEQYGSDKPNPKGKSPSHIKLDPRSENLTERARARVRDNLRQSLSDPLVPGKGPRGGGGTGGAAPAPSPTGPTPFAPAASLDEATAWARANGADEVDWGHLDLETANMVNQALHHVVVRGGWNRKLGSLTGQKLAQGVLGDCRMDAFRFGKGTPIRIGLTAKQHTALLAEGAESRELVRKWREAKLAAARRTVAELRDEIERAGSSYHTRRLSADLKKATAEVSALEEALSIKRHAVGTTPYETMIHELGHAAHSRAMAVDESLLKRSVSVLGGAMRSKVAKFLGKSSVGAKARPLATRISGYAATNTLEYFAEAWTAYHTGERHLLTEAVIDLIEEVIEKAALY